MLAFSLVYWRIDRRGPETRANDAGAKPDWLFPQAGVPEAAPPDWRPVFVDYLFVAFSAAAAFSHADALPLTCDGASSGVEKQIAAFANS